MAEITTMWCKPVTKKRFTKRLLKYQSLTGERINTDTFLNILLDTEEEGVKE